MKPVEDIETFAEGLDHLAESHGMTEKNYYVYFDHGMANIKQLRYDHEYLHEMEDEDDRSH